MRGAPCIAASHAISMEDFTRTVMRANPVSSVTICVRRVESFRKRKRSTGSSVARTWDDMKQPRINNERLRDQSAAGVDSRQDGRIQTTRFIALLASAVAMSGALAHLFELPHKIGLSAADYLTVQQIYRGWALLGIPVAAALVSTLMLAILVRHSRRESSSVSHWNLK